MLGGMYGDGTFGVKNPEDPALVREAVKKSFDERTPHDVFLISRWIKSQHVWIFEGIDDSLLDQISSKIGFKEYVKDTIIFREADMSNCCFIMFAGSVSMWSHEQYVREAGVDLKAAKKSRGGDLSVHEKFLCHLKSGHDNCFGEIGLVTNSFRLVTVKTDSFFEALMIPKGEFDLSIKAHASKLLNQKLDHLRGFRLFSGLEKEQLIRMVAHFTKVNVSPGVELQTQGAEAAHIGFIMEGKLDVVHDLSPENHNHRDTHHNPLSNHKFQKKKVPWQYTPECKLVTLSQISKGQCFGDVCALKVTGAHRVGVRSRTKCVIYLIDSKVFLAMVLEEIYQQALNTARLTSDWRETRIAKSADFRVKRATGKSRTTKAVLVTEEEYLSGRLGLTSLTSGLHPKVQMLKQKWKGSGGTPTETATVNGANVGASPRTNANANPQALSPSANHWSKNVDSSALFGEEALDEEQPNETDGFYDHTGETKEAIINIVLESAKEKLDAGHNTRPPSADFPGKKVLGRSRTPKFPLPSEKAQDQQQDSEEVYSLSKGFVPTQLRRNQRVAQRRNKAAALAANIVLPDDQAASDEEAAEAKVVAAKAAEAALKEDKRTLDRTGRAPQPHALLSTNANYFPIYQQGQKSKR